MATSANDRVPTIVYVEDNAGDALLLEEALHERRYAVHLVIIESGDKALRYFQVKEGARDLPPPHCILLDATLPVIAGSQLLRFIRGSRPFDSTPVYIFAAETAYGDLLRSNIVSKESFLTKSNTWDDFLQLADLLMRSAIARQDNKPASNQDSKPEAHAEGALRRQDTESQRVRAKHTPPRISNR